MEFEKTIIDQRTREKRSYEEVWVEVWILRVLFGVLKYY